MQIAAATKSFPIWTTGIGSQCIKNYLQLLEPGSYSYSCKYSINSEAACLSINSGIVGGTFAFCTTTSCATTISNANTVSAASYNSGLSQCSGAVTSMNIQYQLGYENNSYVLRTASVTFATSTVIGSAQINTNILVTLDGVQSSGNPGYIVGKPLKYASGGIYQIQTSSIDPSCSSASSPSS